MRCFVAIELPGTVGAALGLLQERLRARAAGVRWMRTDQIHLTVKFLGEVADGDLPRVCETAASVAAGYPALELEVGGVGCFPPGGPARIVWAGFVDPPQALLDCREACERRFGELGFQREGRAYHPHLTIGRVKDPRASREIRAAVEQEQSFRTDRFLAQELVLFESVLQPSGPTYTVLSRAGFRRPVA